MRVFASLSGENGPSMRALRVLGPRPFAGSGHVLANIFGPLKFQSFYS